MITDLRWRRIPNVLTFPAAGLGLVFGFVIGGLEGLKVAALGMGIGLGALIVPYLAGGMGAGDVKLMAALGSLVGPHVIFSVFVYTILIGGILSFGKALMSGTLKRAFHNMYFWSKQLVLQRLGGVGGGLTEEELAQTAGIVPYGIAIACGLYWYLVFGGIV
ncbi:MAG: prepilin peptidase [Candidatus Zixiibacteriota bacterium]